MAREIINEVDLEKVSGGSIVFTSDCKTCGYNCNNQFAVNNFNAVIAFIDANKAAMDEREMLKVMMQRGYITRL